MVTPGGNAAVSYQLGEAWDSHFFVERRSSDMQGPAVARELEEGSRGACWGFAVGSRHDLVVGEGGVVELVLRVTRQVLGHQHRFHQNLRVREHSNKPAATLGQYLGEGDRVFCVLTWIKFLPSALVTKGWSLGVVKV
jgi:hypothetical protein